MKAVRRIIAVAVVLMLVLAGYGIYKDESRRTALQEKVKGFFMGVGDIYSNNTTSYISAQKVRKDLQDKADELIKSYPYKVLKIVLIDKQEVVLTLNKSFIIEPSQQNSLQPEKLELYGYFNVNFNTSNEKLSQKYPKQRFFYDIISEVYLKNGKLVFTFSPFVSPKADNLTCYLAPINSEVLSFILSDELIKYTNTNSIAYLNAINSNLLLNSKVYPSSIIVSTDEVFNKQKVYVKSYFRYKDGKFYEIKRESNVREYVEWAKKNL